MRRECRFTGRWNLLTKMVMMRSSLSLKVRLGRRSSSRLKLRPPRNWRRLASRRRAEEKEVYRGLQRSSDEAYVRRGRGDQESAYVEGDGVQ